jgi:hypothetical protein
VDLGSPDGSSETYQPQTECHCSRPVVPLKFPRLSYRIRRPFNHFGYIDSAKNADLSDDRSIDAAYDADITEISIETEGVLIVAAILRGHCGWRPGQNEMTHKAKEQ